jgi:hypothetical protein
MHNRFHAVLYAAVTLSFVLSAALHAQVAAGFNGTWVLNQDKSMFEPLSTRPDRRMMTLAVNGNELTHNTETARTRFLDVEPFQEVSTAKVGYTAKFDGKEYPVPNSSAKVRLKRVNATTIERTATTGKANETATWTISADGKLLTVMTTGVDGEGTPYSSTQIFEKQP